MQARAERSTIPIDWGLVVRPPRWLSHRAYITAVSQLYHGEIATIRMCCDLRADSSDPVEREFLQAQISDETRHIALYRRYLDRLGAVGEAEPALAAALAGRFVWQGSPLGTIIAVHLLLEGEGLRVQREFGRWFPCDLLRQINASISPDEARHIAFGRRALVAQIGTLCEEERVAIYQWLEGLWCECAQSASADIPSFIRLAMGRRWINERWARHRRILVRLGLVSDAEARAAV
jgi:hypothetical protein